MCLTRADVNAGAFSLPVSCRCPADRGQRWPCGAPPPARRCAACTRCCAPPGGAPVCAGLPDPPASFYMSPQALQAGSPGQTSVCRVGRSFQHRHRILVKQYIWVEMNSSTTRTRARVNAENSIINTDVREKLNWRLCVGCVGAVSQSVNWEYINYCLKEKVCEVLHLLFCQ